MPFKNSNAVVPTFGTDAERLYHSPLPSHIRMISNSTAKESDILYAEIKEEMQYTVCIGGHSSKGYPIPQLSTAIKNSSAYGFVENSPRVIHRKTTCA